MRSAPFYLLLLYFFALVTPAYSSYPLGKCVYALGDAGHEQASLPSLRKLASLSESDLEKSVRDLSSIELLRTANDVVQILNHGAGVKEGEREKSLPELAIKLAWIVGQRAAPEERLPLVRWLLNRAETLPQDWEKQFLLNEIIDATSGIDTRRIDAEVTGLSDSEVARRFGNEQTWFRFGNRDLLTPYFEFQNILAKLEPRPGQRIVLLGSGLGREAIPTSIRYPGVEVTGYEIVSERVAASEALRKNLGLSGVKFHEQNLADPDFKPEPADIYYAFNPVSGTTFDKILSDLKSNAKKFNRPFKIVVSGPAPYGKFTKDGSGFTEVTPEPRFEGDDFARVFSYDPKVKAAERSVASTANRRDAVPHFPETGEFKLEDRDWVEASLKEHPIDFAHVHFPTLWSWQSSDKSETTQILGLPTLVRKENGRRVFLEPLTGSAKDKAAAIRFAMLATRPGELPPKFEYVSEAVANELTGVAKLSIAPVPERADYIYHTATLAALEHLESQSSDKTDRKRLKEKRQQADAFRDGNPEAKYLTFTKESPQYEKVQQFLHAWRKARAEKLGADGLAEAKASERMLEQMDTLGYEGRLIEVDGQVVAFSLGLKNRDDTFTIYAQKADPGSGPGAAGIYPYFFREQARELQRRGVAYINLQGDEGVQGMRQMKKALGPKGQIMSYQVTRE